MNRSFRSIKKIVRRHDMQANAVNLVTTFLLLSDDIRLIM